MTKGQLMAGEMAEQPDVLARLVDRAAEVRASVAGVVPDDLAACVIVARGSSDHAALLGQYLLQPVPPPGSHRPARSAGFAQPAHALPGARRLPGRPGRGGQPVGRHLRDR